MVRSAKSDYRKQIMNVVAFPLFLVAIGSLELIAAQPPGTVNIVKPKDGDFIDTNSTTVVTVEFTGNGEAIQRYVCITIYIQDNSGKNIETLKKCVGWKNNSRKQLINFAFSQSNTFYGCTFTVVACQVMRHPVDIYKDEIGFCTAETIFVGPPSIFLQSKLNCQAI